MYILIAEDNSVNQKLLQLVLKKLGYDSDIASNGMEALLLMRSRKYDLILMDVQMPEMDGFETTKRIFEEFGQNRPRIVAMTANALQGDREMCLNAGMDDYISKPAKPEDIKNAIERYRSSITMTSSYHLKNFSSDDVLDKKTFGMLFDLVPGDANVVPSLLAMFSQQTLDIIVGLEQAATEGDFATAKAMTHKMKGICINMGAAKMGSACRWLEENFSNTHKDDLIQELLNLKALREETITVMTAFSPPL